MIIRPQILDRTLLFKFNFFSFHVVLIMYVDQYSISIFLALIYSNDFLLLIFFGNYSSCGILVYLWYHNDEKEKNVIQL